MAGNWIRENIGGTFDRYYTSEYVRAMETAALLDLPDAKWYTEIVLRERDKGHMDNVSYPEKKTVWKDEMDRRKRDSFYWCPPQGESLAHVCQRVEHTFNTLRRDCTGKRVIIVCHGEGKLGKSGDTHQRSHVGVQSPPRTHVANEVSPTAKLRKPPRQDPQHPNPPLFPYSPKNR